MHCFMCGTQADMEDTCPRCGANLSVYRQILYSADACYNQGLERARVRDLSGAVESLQQALRYNKYHVQARNLLGLAYFELGELVHALSEWVISQNLSPDDAQSKHFLDEVQNTPGLLEQLDTMSRKYNQALIYCQQNSRDLAIIQLRKLVNNHKNFVAGRQLLALLYIQEGKYADARRELIAAGKLDVRNTLTLRYNQEVREILRARKGKRAKKDYDSAINDVPELKTGFGAKFMDVIDASRSSMLNILMGVVLGLLACYFLIIPTIKQNAKSEAATEVVSISSELSGARTQIQELEDEIEALLEQIEEYLLEATVDATAEQDEDELSDSIEGEESEGEDSATESDGSTDEEATSEADDNTEEEASSEAESDGDTDEEATADTAEAAE